MTPSRDDLLKHYAKKPVQRFYQLDGWIQGEDDSFFTVDEDGDVLVAVVSYQLISSLRPDFPIRVFVHEDANPDDVGRLRKTADGVEDRIRDYQQEDLERELFARAGIDPDAGDQGPSGPEDGFGPEDAFGPDIPF